MHPYIARLAAIAAHLKQAEKSISLEGSGPVPAPRDSLTYQIPAQLKETGYIANTVQPSERQIRRGDFFDVESMSLPMR